MPSLHPYRVWRLFHNSIHHAFTNLRGRDYIWVPLSLKYSKLSCFGVLLNALSSKGVGVYYLIEVWLRQMMFKYRRTMLRHDGAYIYRLLITLSFAMTKSPPLLS
jgi:omega-6 fatty acid desaturase (delta-12 desaturase)